MTAELTPETLRLAGEGADSLEQVALSRDGSAGQAAYLNHYHEIKHEAGVFRTQAAAIKSLIAHATEMQAVMKHKASPTTEGWYFWRWWCETSHGVPAQWSSWQTDWFSSEDIAAKDHSKNTLATRNFIGPFNPTDFALTETKRPATTGEGMGEG